jgi:hypothetical protein
MKMDTIFKTRIVPEPVDEFAELNEAQRYRERERRRVLLHLVSGA